MTHHTQRGSRRAVRRGTGLAIAGLALSVLPVLALHPADAAPAPAADPGDTDLWTPVSASRSSLDATLDAARADRRVEPRAYGAYRLDLAGLGDLLSTAPAEARGTAAGTLLEVPSPDGDLVQFEVTDSPVMEPGLAAAHPEISTWAGRAVGSAATIRLDVTPMGFHASVRSPGEASWYVDPAANGTDAADGVYLSYLGSSLPTPEKALVEPELDLLPPDDSADAAAADAVEAQAGEAPGSLVGLRSYRLALVTDPSYARYFGTANVLAEKVTLMNRVNQIYNDDFAVRMLLIDQTDALNLDTDAKAFGPDGGCGPAGCFAPDQFADGCTGNLLTRNQFALGQLVGPENYDIGHVALGINGGGIAGLGVVGANGKAWGCTGLPQPEGDFMAIDYVAHEMGHQFGGNHTFNGTEVNCGGNKAAPSVEPGSGSSVMAYAGICGQDDLQPHTDPYFSQWSQQEITAYITARRVVNEIQTVQLSGFDTDGDSFTLGYAGRTSAPIVRGTSYTRPGIEAALEAILPADAQVRIAPLGGSGRFTDQGFQVTFNDPATRTPANPLRGEDVEDLVASARSGITGTLVGETTRGGLLTNGGQVVTPTANHTPVATAPATVSVPLRTPFALTGSATDADGDPMVYLWEQRDRGAGAGTSLVDQTKTNGPLFRVFGTYADVTPAGTLQIGSPGENIADASTTRTFPDMEQVLVNNTNAATGTCPTPPAPPTSGASNVPVSTRDCFSEWLPTRDYVGSSAAGNTEPSLNFRFTARDQVTTGGGYGFADTTVLIDPTAGPFLVSSKNTPAAAVAGRSEAVSWAVAGTNRSLAANVKISLSTDGGRTFPTVLQESTPNDGSEAVTWPDVTTTTARIKIEAVGNVFFDVNNADFEIQTRAGTTPTTPTTPPGTTPGTTPPVTPPPATTPGTAAATAAAPVLTVGKAKRKKRNGVAVLPVSVTVPSAVTLTGRRVRNDGSLAAPTTTMKVTAKGKARRTLRRTGRVRVPVTVTALTVNGTAVTVTRKVTLVRRR